MNSSNAASQQQLIAALGIMAAASYSPRQNQQQNTTTHSPHSMRGSVSSKESLESPASNVSSPLPFHPVRALYNHDQARNLSVSDASRVGEFVGGQQQQQQPLHPFRSPPRDSQGMKHMYQPHASPYANHAPPNMSPYQDNHAPQPMRYTSPPPHETRAPPPPYAYPPPYPPHPTHIMAPTSSSDSSYSTYPPFPYAMHAHSSFESHASSSTTGPTPYVTYSYGPAATTVIAAYPHTQYPPWMMPPPKIEYIEKIEPQDVLCGRGGATNSHSGNRAFRLLVKRHQDRYLRAKKRDKPSVASYIVELVRDRGGRFLRRCDTTPQGNVLWVDIGDDRAREKTCQALREGAPEIRRRRSKSFEEKMKRKDTATTDEEEEESSTEQDGSSGGDMDMKGRDKDVESPKKKAKQVEELERKSEATAVPKTDARDDSEGTRDDGPLAEEKTKEPPVIRPSARLMKRSTTMEITMAELTPKEREMYLRDFLPPDATTKGGPKRREVIRIARHYTPVAEGDDDDDSSMMEKDDDDWEADE